METARLRLIQPSKRFFRDGDAERFRRMRLQLPIFDVEVPHAQQASELVRLYGKNPDWKYEPGQVVVDGIGKYGYHILVIFSPSNRRK